jgi:hypothetical protein
MLATLNPLPGYAGSAFAFYQYDRAKDQVALRIAFHRDSCGMCPGLVSQLGMWVRPKSEMRRYFVEAAGTNGFYMSSRFQGRRLHGARFFGQGGSD